MACVKSIAWRRDRVCVILAVLYMLFFTQNGEKEVKYYRNAYLLWKITKNKKPQQIT